MERTTPNRTVAGGGVGGALGVSVVIMVPKFTEIVFSADEASMLTAAFGIVFGWLIRYLPQPRASGLSR